jgi:probable F420-dependent oxidoreductase
MIMNIGVLVILTEQTGEPGEIAHEGETLGFESFWVGEHLFIPVHTSTHYPRSADGKVPEFYAHFADPFVALSAAARATSRIRLATGICLLPERNVIATAKAVATLDMYSQGRLILGVGAGWLVEEAEIMGVQFKRRWQHLRESVEALRELWTKDEASYEGEFIKFPPVRLFPKPVQKPGPPIVLGAHDPKYAIKRVARFGDGWCPANLTPEQARETLPQIKRLAQEAGRDPDSLEFSVFLLGQDGGPDIDTIKRYQEAGVSRLVVLSWAAASGSGIEAVRSLAPVVERAQHV